MAGSIAKLVVSLGANISNFETDMKRASTLSKKELAKMERQAKRLNDTWNRNFKYAGAAVATGLTIATKAAAEFEKAMAEVATLGTANIDALGESVKQLAVEFGQAPVDQARALYQIISAGASDSATQLELLTAANKLAVGGITDVAVAADGLTTVLNAYEGSGLTAQNVSDILFATMKGGKTTVDELTQSVGQVATIASQTGVSFAELGATVATLTKSGLNTSEAMTSLRSVLSAVLKQTDKTQAAADDIGIQFDIAALKAKGLSGVLQDIANSGATEEQLSALVGRVEGLTAVLSSVRNSGAEFSRQLQSITESAGLTEEAVAQMAATTSFQLDRLTAAISVIGIEIGAQMLAPIAAFAEAVVKNMDRVLVAVETVAAVIVARVGVAMVAAFTSAAAGATALATAMAFVGGPVGLVATAVAALVVNWDNLLARQDALGNFVRQLDRGFTVLLGVIKAVAFELANLVQIALDVFDLVAAPLSAIITTLGQAAKLISEGRLVDAGQALGDIVEASGQRASAAFERLKENIDDIGDGAEFMIDAWNRSAAALGDATENADDLADAVDTAARSTDALTDTGKQSAKALDKMADKADEAAAAAKRLNNEMKKAVDAGRQSSAMLSETIRNLQEVIDEQEAYEQALQDTLDRLYPLEAAGRQLGDTLALLTRALNEGALNWDQYQDAVNRAVAGFEQANAGMQQMAQGLDYLSIAIDESVRILERTFQDVFESIIDQSADAWDAVRSGFESLVATIARTPIRIVTQQIQQAFQPGGGGLSSLSLSGQFGQDLLVAAGTILGASMADSFGGQIGQIVGGIAGKAFGATFFTALGSFAGPVGTVLGNIIGALVGDWIADLFSNDRFFVNLGGSNVSPGRNLDRFETPLGTVTMIDSENLGFFSEGGKPGGQIAKAITDFDTAIFEILQAVGGTEYVDEIRGILANWTGFWEDGTLTIENILGSRWQAILTAFEDDVRMFVQRGADLEEQVQRLGAALTLEKFLKENPGVFGERTLGEVLEVVEAFKAAGGTMEDALESFIRTAEVVVGVTTALRQFADSDIRADLNALLNPLSLGQSLAVVREGLQQAIAEYDGSIESLQTIGELSLIVREGELKLLAQIDAIQKGLNSNLDRLKADILGVGAEPKSTQQILFEADKLVDAVRKAKTPEEVARLGRDFEALIRQIPEADILAIGPQIIASLITQFQNAANAQLDAFTESTISEGEALRGRIDEFLTDIGDPLQIIANSLEGESIPAVMEEGLADITEEIGTIGPQVAGAIREGLGNVNVTVVVQESGLVTQ